MSPLKGITGRSNVVGRRVLPWVPGFAVVEYRGRKTGRAYTTPVKVFRHEGDRVVAMTFGQDVQWVRNVQAADGCVIRIRRHRYPLTGPTIVDDPDRRLVPVWARPLMAMVDVHTFLVLHPGPDRSTGQDVP